MTKRERAQSMAERMRDLALRAESPDEREACDVAAMLFSLHASQARAVERGEVVQIEIPVVVGPEGHLVMEVDSRYGLEPTSAREVAERMSRDPFYRGTPYVVAVTLPTFKPVAADVVVGDVAPC